MKKALFICVTALMLLSCKTYTVTPERFKEQFITATDSNALKGVTVSNPFGGTITYNANQLEYIEVVSKDGFVVNLENTPSLEMRVTLKDGKKKIMYFDTVYIENDVLHAKKSRFISSLEQEIPFGDIVKIEIQDGRKKFSYQ